jgi:argininosuccinate lyase
MIMNNAAGEKTLRYGQTRGMVLFVCFVIVEWLNNNDKEKPITNKTFLFSAVDISHITILVFTQMLAGLKFNTEHLLFKSDKNFLTATDLADYLALKKIPFREAHHLVGQIVSYSLKHKKELSELSLDEFKSFSKLIEKDIYALLSPEGSVSRRNVVGGTAPKQVLAAIKKNKLKYKGN